MAGKNPWGIRKADLSRLWYPDLRDVFYGFHNLSIPWCMLYEENPDEIIAQYLAAGRFKGGNVHLRSDLPREFFELVRVMNRLAYSGSPGLRVLRANCRKKFSDSPGQQRRRLEALEQEVQEAFVKSFFHPYRHANTPNPDGYNFSDPNIDGRSSRVYVNTIFGLIEGNYERHLQQNRQE